MAGRGDKDKQRQVRMRPLKAGKGTIPEALKTGARDRAEKRKRTCCCLNDRCDRRYIKISDTTQASERRTGAQANGHIVMQSNAEPR